ncbi:MAG: Fe-S-binding domain-containing protein, partial [Microthrixaceae bacterium]
MTASAFISPVLAAAEGSASPSFPILPALIAVPLIGALIIALVPRSRGDLFKPIALLTSITTAAISIYLLTAFETGDAGYQFVVDQTWISRLGISFHL